LTGETKKWLESTGERLKLSGRSLHRCLRVARTIADLTGAASVSQTDLTEALAYRIAIKANP
jgi:magnesium chelatase family protein